MHSSFWGSAFHIFFKTVEIADGIPADLDDFFDVKGIHPSLSWLERDFYKFHPFLIIYEIGGEHNVRNIEILGKSGKKSAEYIGSHQTKGCVGVRNLYAENQAEKDADHMLHKFS